MGTWGPFVFVNPDPDAEPLEEALGDLPAVVAENGLDVDALRFHHRVTWSINANWKIAIENYLECYHCQLNHPDLMHVIDEEAQRHERRGLGSASSRRSTPTRSTGTPPTPSAAECPPPSTTSSSRQ